jgi:CBS domain-containing protein
MAGDFIYAFRVMRLPLLDAEGVVVGRLNDIVVVPGSGREAPRVIGFTAESQRRRIFVNSNRVVLESDGARLKSWDLDLNPFKPRAGEILLGRDVIDKRLGDETVSDVALIGGDAGWRVAKVRLARRSALRRQSSRSVDWREVAQLFSTGEMAAEAARFREMHPSDVAQVLRVMPLAKRRQVAAMLEDDTLADLLEELPEAEQLRLIEGLDVERVMNVLDEMEYDDLTDLLAEMPGEQRNRILAAMEPAEADVLRRLLSYDEGTAGSLMIPDPIILGPNTTVAEALAHVRNPDHLVSIAAQVFVTHPPFVPPTGRYLGVVHFQRLLREPPSTTLARCLELEPTIGPTVSDREVAERLAAYNMLAVAVCDEDDHLLGAITVDDVLDRVLPAGWRQRRCTEVAPS